MIELASFFAAAAIGIGVMALLEFGIIKPYLRWKCAKSKTPETKTGGELCPECQTNWVFEGQWSHSVDDSEMHKLYQRMANGEKHKYLTDGLTYESCEECAVDWETDYVKHLARRYDTWGATACEPENCMYCAEEDE